MKESLAIGSLLVGAVVIEIVVPGASAYHNGWLNVGLAALLVVLLARAGFTIVTAGVTAIVLAGIAFGLFAPDPQTVIGAPGSTRTVDGVTLVFPLEDDHMSRRYAGSFILQPLPRPVVSVDVGDAGGHALTMTQPDGAAFLSPVLLMQASQSIAGMDLPYDSFSVPAAQRTVKAVLLSRAALANMPGVAHAGDGAVLFDVETEGGAPVANGIGLAHDGERVALGGLTLRPRLRTYPAIRLDAIPNPFVVLAGFIVLLVGLTRARLVR